MTLAAGQSMRQIAINAGDELQKVQCFANPEDLIGESTVEITDCGDKKGNCPEPRIAADGTLMFQGWKIEHTKTLITCRNGDVNV